MSRLLAVSLDHTVDAKFAVYDEPHDGEVVFQLAWSLRSRVTRQEMSEVPEFLISAKVDDPEHWEWEHGEARVEQYCTQASYFVIGFQSSQFYRRERKGVGSRLEADRLSLLPSSKP